MRKTLETAERLRKKKAMKMPEYVGMSLLKWHLKYQGQKQGKVLKNE